MFCVRGRKQFLKELPFARESDFNTQKHRLKVTEGTWEIPDMEEALALGYLASNVSSEQKPRAGFRMRPEELHAVAALDSKVLH
jgi:hypothetical protein